MNKTQIALIGCGGMGNYHAGFFLKIDEAEIIGICDLIEEKAKKSLSQ